MCMTNIPLLVEYVIFGSNDIRGTEVLFLEYDINQTQILKLPGPSNKCDWFVLNVSVSKYIIHTGS